MTDPSAIEAATSSSLGRSELPRLVRQAPIVEVVVHARGAVVTRRVHLDDVPDDTFELVCPGVTLAAEASGVRCEVVRGEALVTTVRTRVDIPTRDQGPAASRARVEELDRQIRRLNDEHRVLQQRVQRLEATSVEPALGRSLVEVGAASRVEAATAAIGLVAERIEHLQERLAEIELQHRKVSREREAAALEDAQSSTDQRDLTTPSRAVVMTIEPGEGALTVAFSYVVRTARWWPLYTLRIDDDGRSASLLLEAQVAQATGEDWERVRIGFATSDIVSDAQLPRLPAYRLGRAQPEPRSGFRAPPQGVDRLFASFDLAMDGARPDLLSRQGAPSAPPPTSASYAASEAASYGGRADDTNEEMVAVELMAQASVMKEEQAPRMKAKRMRAPAPAASMQAASMQEEAEMLPDVAFGGGVEVSLGGGPSASRGGPGSGPSTQVEPNEDWLRFDDVTLASASEGGRGRLRRKSRMGGGEIGSVHAAVERAERMGAVDPHRSRGSFDHRYDAEAVVDVPSDGALHRVEIVTAACPSTLSWRTNPREDSSVYREVMLDNPHPSPLLAGPLDVYVRGSLVANTTTATVDRGGTMNVGLGVDERIRVARNARVREESAGLLGGKREIDHFVDIELASALGFDAMVEVVDRIPVSRDEHVEVDLFESVPEGEAYDQTDRDQAVEGGRRWRIEVMAGDQATIRFAYRIKLRAKDELVGGNRRD